MAPSINQCNTRITRTRPFAQRNNHPRCAQQRGQTSNERVNGEAVGAANPQLASKIRKIRNYGISQ
eukprot:1188679-Prorocentrum_minimum.AAC.2